MIKTMIGKRHFAFAGALLVSLGLLLTSCGTQADEQERAEKLNKNEGGPFGGAVNGMQSAKARDLDEEEKNPENTLLVDDICPMAYRGDVTAGSVNGEKRARPGGDIDGYAKMPGPYGKSRNKNGYSADCARDVTYYNFLKLEVGMSLEDVKEIISDAETEAIKYSDMTWWMFDSGPTRIRVEIVDGELVEAIYHDDYRIFVDASDIDLNMDMFRRLEKGMSVDDVKGILGESFFKKSFSAMSRSDASRLAWFCEEGEIEVIFDYSGKVAAFMQEGLQYVPDSRMKYEILTDRQIMESFKRIDIGTSSSDLESLMGNYVPLSHSTVNLNFRREVDLYRFDRRDGNGGICVEFEFEDGKLFRKEFISLPKTLLPETDLSSAERIRAGMTYSRVSAILGEGFKLREEKGFSGHEEKYSWNLPGGDEFLWSYLEIQFLNGAIPSEVYINLFVPGLE